MNLKDDLINLITILDTAITSNRRKSIFPVLILLEHYINQHHSNDTTVKLTIDESGHRFKETNYSLFSKKLIDIKNDFNQNKPTAHLVFSIRHLIESLAQVNSTIFSESETQLSTDHINPTEIFANYLKSIDSRMTKTKQFIVDEIFALNDHFEVDQFILDVNKKDLKIARATVYRTIKQLIEAGLLQKISTTTGKVFYEKSSPKNEHAHLICNKCGKLLEIKDIKIRSLLEQYCKKMNFELQYQSIHLHGECLDKSNCK
jgi:Fur family ferric uptake transcriptional regulator